MVLHDDEYALQQQKENELETKLAKEYCLSVEEYRAQKDLLDEEYTKQQQQIQEEIIAKDYGLSLEEYRAQKEMLEQAIRARDVEHRERMNLAFEDEKPTHTYSNFCTVQKLSHSLSPSERSPYTDLPSLPPSSSDPPIQDQLPTQDPSQFAVGSLVYMETQRGDPLRGVVMWIGTSPEFPGEIAGVELVSHIALIH